MKNNMNSQWVEKYRPDSIRTMNGSADLIRGVMFFLWI